MGPHKQFGPLVGNIAICKCSLQVIQSKYILNFFLLKLKKFSPILSHLIVSLKLILLFTSGKKMDSLLLSRG